MWCASPLRSCYSPGRGQKPTRDQTPSNGRGRHPNAQLGEPSYLAGGSSKGLVAPILRRQRFIVILKKGNPEDNTRTYTPLLVFETAESLAHLGLLFCSRSPRLRIAKPSKTEWLDDNETVSFHRENPKETPQSNFHIRTKNLEVDRHPRHRFLRHQPRRLSSSIRPTRLSKRLLTRNKPAATE